jgi:hypothetical protein
VKGGKLELHFRNQSDIQDSFRIVIDPFHDCTYFLFKDAAKMRFLKTLLGFTRLDRQRNPDMCNSLKVNSQIEDTKLY